MFTGIVESLGVVKKLRKKTESAVLTIETQNNILDDVKIGDSIATNGVCLTVTHLSDCSFEADVMNETMKITSLSSLALGDIVNLERALQLSDRLGGHIVSGHIDGVGEISNIQQNDIAYIFTIKTTSNILKYIIKRGSITIDGISLTVINISDIKFQVSIIPHTVQKTNLLKKKIGDPVNLETDIIAKYVERLLNSSIYLTSDTNITEKFLRENGF